MLMMNDNYAVKSVITSSQRCSLFVITRVMIDYPQRIKTVRIPGEL